MILITGASGRIGRAFANFMAKRGEEVRALIRSEYKGTGLSGVEVRVADLLDKEAVKKACEGVGTVYHLAALLDYEASQEDLRKNNVEATRNLLEECRGKKFVYLSSTAVMGKKLAKIPADETTECRPTDYYGVTKLEAEKLVREAGGIVVRSADVYGPGFTEGYYDLFGLIGSGRMRIFGDGKNRIQYVHIRDLMRALVLAEHFGRPGEVYIITGPDARTQEELYKMVADRLDVAPPSRHISPWLAKMAAKFKGKESFVPIIEKLAADRVFDISKAKRELGYEPKITYEVGIGEVIDEYKKEKVRLDLLRMRKSQQASQASSSFESGWESP